MSQFPNAKPVDGKGGDEGIDTYIGDFDGAIHIYQHKYFLNRLQSAQRRQIERSLAQALATHTMVSWTLMLPIDLNPAEIRWFETLRKKAPGVIIDWWGKSKLELLISEQPALATDFLPPPNVVTVIFKNELSTDFANQEAIRRAVKSALGILDTFTSPDEAINDVISDVLSRSRLKVLVWGPGPSGGDLHRKRQEIRNRLRALGHQADFSEDVWSPERLRQSGLNLKVAEFIQAKSYDYIVCLMVSPGSIGEVHDFANDQHLATKMMICVDSAHRAGYTARGALRIFEGFNGKLDWFDNPADIEECHLSTRVLEHVDKVAESKQYLVANARGSQ